MKKLSTLLFLSLSIYVFSQVPSGYYNLATGKNTSDLRSTLQAIISYGHNVTSYDGLWTAYKTTDENSSGKIWDMYSNCTFIPSNNQCGNYSSECDCYNREHTSPQSWFNSESPMVSDLFNTYPTDGKVNGERSNYPYGEVATATLISANGSKLGTSNNSEYTGVVFEPVDEYKGDFARTYFYMATRYAGLCESWTAGAEVIYSNANFGLTTYAKKLLLKWSRQDPVSAKEILRNNAVYGVQNNRNPFIDNPGLEEYIWGNKTSDTFTPTNVNPTYLASPTKGVTIDFGNVIFQTSDTISVIIKGCQLTGDVSLVLSGTNYTSFSIATSTISQENAQIGYKLILNYSAQNLGFQTAQLTISGGGIATTTVTLNANCIDGFKALPSSDISTSGFTSNWTSSAYASGYSLNIYSLSGNGSNGPNTLLENDFLTGLPFGWISSGYTDSSTASTVRLSSGANFGKITTPALDLSTSKTTLTVKAKQYSNDTGAKLAALVNSDTLATWITGTDYQNFTVDIPLETSTSKISLYATSGSGHRVYVDYIKLGTQGVVQTPVSVIGYPKSVGNVLNFSVTDLQNDSAYFYTVTPEGNTSNISDQISVRTLKFFNAVEVNNLKSIIWSILPEGVYVRNLPDKCTVYVSDIMGKQIHSFQNASFEIKINLSQKGIYFLRVKQNQEFKTYKIKF